MLRRQYGGAGEIQAERVLLAEDWAKKHKRNPVILPIVVDTRGVIPKQTVASLAKFKV
jgi:hypothetical protein